MEIWKSVSKKEFSNCYKVSTKGNILNINSNKICSQHIRNGYKAVNLYNPETKKKNTYNVHRLVTEAFINNPGNKPFVNHIDGNKENNNMENLEWVTAKENSAHAEKTGLHKPHSKAVNQYTIKGEYINTYSSIIEAAKETGANDRKISAVCKGQRNTTGGFIWEYVIDEPTVPESINGIEIKDFPNYLITKDGQVYSKRAKKFLITKILPSGYHCVKLCNNGNMVDAYINKLIRDHYPIEEPFSPKLIEKSIDGSGENSEV
jgi:hypothetical protein